MQIHQNKSCLEERSSSQLIACFEMYFLKILESVEIVIKVFRTESSTFV